MWRGSAPRSVPAAKTGESMIIVRMTSGLGNQMFQYNFYRLMQELYPETTVKADVRWLYRNDPHHGYELDRVFPSLKEKAFQVKAAHVGEIFRVTGQLYGCPKNHTLASLWSRLTGPLNRKLRNGKYRERFSSQVIEDTTGEMGSEMILDDEGKKVSSLYRMLTHLDPAKDYYITSYFSSEVYYRDRLDRLQKELAFSEPEDETNRRLLERIDHENSVSIHLRRGDYLAPENKDRFKTLDDSYYGEAISVIRSRVDDPQFFVFSDDVSFAKELFAGRSEPMTFVSHNTGKESYRDMQLMSRCRHNIIANSTFSLWAALLNSNKGHITVYPKDYMFGEDTEEKTLPDWIRV